MNTELININNARGGFYSLLSKIYSYMPDKLYPLLDEVFADLKNFAQHTEHEDIINGIALLEEFINTRSSLDEKALGDFDLENLRKYTSLFCISTSVKTDESYYTSSKQLLRQESADEMIALFNKYKLKLSDNVHEYEDHISVEYIFMARLALDSVECLKNNDINTYNALVDEQKAFYENHFDRWVNIFFNEILSHPSNATMYKALTLFTRGYMAEDKLILNELKI